MDEAYMMNGTIFSGFASYKMTSLTGTSNSSVLKVMLITTVIAPLTVIVTVIWLSYSYGGLALPGSSGYSQTTGFSGTINPDSWVQKPSSEPVAPYVLAGFLIVAVLDFLHARFVWFPFSAIGFVIGMSRLSIKWGFWGPLLIAWVLKVITLRIGSSKLRKTRSSYGRPALLHTILRRYGAYALSGFSPVRRSSGLVWGVCANQGGFGRQRPDETGELIPGPIG